MLLGSSNDWPVLHSCNIFSAINTSFPAKVNIACQSTFMLMKCLREVKQEERDGYNLGVAMLSAMMQGNYIPWMHSLADKDETFQLDGIVLLALVDPMFDYQLARNCFRVFDPGIFTNKVEFQEKQCKRNKTPHNMMLEDGGMALLDMGAEYNLYGSDITYSFMVNGKFKRDQRTISNAVLDAHDAIIATKKPGAHQLPLLDLGSLWLEEFDPFWIATLDSTIETQQRLMLMNSVFTCSNELFLMTQPHLKIVLKCRNVFLGRAIIRDYDGFNGPGSSQDPFNFGLAFVRDYDGFNGPGHTLRTRCL